MSNQYDLIVIGGGPGGLMAAAESAGKGFRVLVLEKNGNPGKKLLVTGGGQCNLTHEMPLTQFLTHYHEKATFAGKSIRKFPPEALRLWFEKRGVPLEATETGKVFPVSRKASDVLNALLKQMNLAGVSLKCNFEVRTVSYQQHCFEVANETDRYRSKNVLIATGGLSYPSLGSNGGGYRLAEKLGHRIISPRPSLSSAVIRHFTVADLAGISIPDASISLWRNHKKVSTYRGDLLITHEGVSGPVILNNARHFLPGDLLKVNLVPPYDEELYSVVFLEKLSISGKLMIKTILSGEGIPRRLLERVLSLAEISENQLCAGLNREKRKTLVKLMTGLPFEIEKVKGYEEAMATAGGVATEDVNGSTMASRLVQGLFFAGEVLDVDGMTGGFNLQFAFSSGYAAATAVCEKQIPR